MDRRVMLKVKIKSLAEEARIIRKEEHKKPFLREALYLHRVGVVRFEARAAQLAYGYIRGRSMAQMEPKTNDDKWQQSTLLKRVRELVEKYGLFKTYADDEWKTYDTRKKQERDGLEGWFYQRNDEHGTGRVVAAVKTPAS